MHSPRSHDWWRPTRISRSGCALGSCIAAEGREGGRKKRPAKRFRQRTPHSGQQLSAKLLGSAPLPLNEIIPSSERKRSKNAVVMPTWVHRTQWGRRPNTQDHTKDILEQLAETSDGATCKITKQNSIWLELRSFKGPMVGVTLASTYVYRVPVRNWRRERFWLLVTRNRYTGRYSAKRSRNTLRRSHQMERTRRLMTAQVCMKRVSESSKELVAGVQKEPPINQIVLGVASKAVYS